MKQVASKRVGWILARPMGEAFHAKGVQNRQRKQYRSENLDGFNSHGASDCALPGGNAFTGGGPTFRVDLCQHKLADPLMVLAFFVPAVSLYLKEAQPPAFLHC